jgi:hypothetical protein
MEIGRLLRQVQQISKFVLRQPLDPDQEFVIRIAFALWNSIRHFVISAAPDPKRHPAANYPKSSNLQRATNE